MTQQIIPGPESLRLRPIRLAASVAALTTVTLKYPITQDATLVGLRIRIYRGTELDLRVLPFIVNAREQMRNLIAFVPGGKQYIDGDDDTFNYPISEPVDADAGDELRIQVTNLSGVYAYDFAVDVSMDLSNGQYPGVNRLG